MQATAYYCFAQLNVWNLNVCLREERVSCSHVNISLSIPFASPLRFHRQSKIPHYAMSHAIRGELQQTAVGGRGGGVHMISRDQTPSYPLSVWQLLSPEETATCLWTAHWRGTWKTDFFSKVLFPAISVYMCGSSELNKMSTQMQRQENRWWKSEHWLVRYYYIIN